MPDYAQIQSLEATDGHKQIATELAVINLLALAFHCPLPAGLFTRLDSHR